MYSLGIVQWDFTRRNHPGNPGRVFGSSPVTVHHRRRSRHCPPDFLVFQFSTSSPSRRKVTAPPISPLRHRRSQSLLRATAASLLCSTAAPLLCASPLEMANVSVSVDFRPDPIRSNSRKSVDWIMDMDMNKIQFF